MIIAFIFILIAWAWLMIETDMLRIHLPCGDESQKISKELITEDGLREHTTDLPQDNFTPSVFTELDMPDTKGELNIVCEVR